MVQRKLDYLDKCLSSKYYKDLQSSVIIVDKGLRIHQCFNINGTFYIYLTKDSGALISKQSKTIVFKDNFFIANYNTSLPTYLDTLDRSSIPRLNLCWFDNDIRFRFCTFDTLRQSLEAEKDKLIKMMNV